MKSIRTSISEDLKLIISSIVKNENSPFRNESELLRIALGIFVSNFMDFSTVSKIENENTWEDVLAYIMNRHDVSTVELKDKFPLMKNVMYYHLKNMTKRGIIKFVGTWRADIELGGKNVTKTSGYWQVTELGNRLLGARDWKSIPLNSE